MKEKDQIEKFFKNVSEHPIKTLIILVIIVHILLFLIQLPFWVGRNGGIPVDFNVGDMMVFIGTMIAASATLFLGLIAYVQNLRLSRVNTELMNIQNQALIPVIEISDHATISSRAPIKDFIKKPYEYNLSKSKNPDSEFSKMSMKFHLYEDLKILEETTIKLMLKNITPNLIKKLTVIKVKTNVVESGDKSTIREFDLSGNLGVNSTQHFMSMDSEVYLFITIFTNGDNSAKRFLHNLSAVEIELEINSLTSSYTEVICLKLIDNGILDIKYDIYGTQLSSPNSVFPTQQESGRIVAS